jgi:hypothetical protein
MQMAKRLSDAQRKVLNEIGTFGLQGGYYSGKTAQIIILEDCKLIVPRGVSKFAVTLSGCEHVGINYTDAIDAIHEIALLENNDRPIVEVAPAPAITTIAEDESNAAMQMIERYSGHTYFENRATPASVETIIVAKLMKTIDTAASGSVERWLIQQNLIDFVLPQIENRDAEIALLKAQIEKLNALVETKQEKIEELTISAGAYEYDEGLHPQGDALDGTRFLLKNNFGQPR